VALARSQAGLGLNDQALETYRQIAKECADSPLDSSVAMLHLARWVAENDSLNAIPVFKELVRTFPDEPAARQAVTWIKDLMLPNNGQAQTANELMQFANEIRPDGQAKANVLYTAAELLVATDSDSQLALDLYDQIITDFPAHGLSNDAMMAKAHLLINLDRPAEAVKVLEALLGRRQWSFLIGSYEVDLYKKASEMLPEVAAKAGESPKEIERRQREHHRRYSQ
jgi:tetratricopeptide (TPR) repeat protein